MRFFKKRWVLASLISASAVFFFLEIYSHLNQLEIWMSNHQALTLLWRLGILAAIFISWPWFIRARARARSWPLQHIQSAIKLRYSLVLILLVLDILFQLGS